MSLARAVCVCPDEWGLITGKRVRKKTQRKADLALSSAAVADDESEQQEDRAEAGAEHRDERGDVGREHA